MTPFDPETLKQAVASPRWTALTRIDANIAEVTHWDPTLLRESRVLVPIDVQALFVEPGATDEAVRLPFGLTEPDGQPAAPMPAPLVGGAAREAGVHLHWAMPDALIRGTLAARPDGSTNRLGLPALPDRWLVLRFLVPRDATQVVTRGWVLCADTGTVVPLDRWQGETVTPPAARHTVAAGELTGSVGGSVQWAATYDAVIDRFAFHDPLDDLATVAPNGVAAEQIGYMVSGWWSHAELDPLDAARTDSSLHTLLASMQWHLAEPAGDTMRDFDAHVIESIKRDTLGLVTGARYAAPQQSFRVEGAMRATPGFDPTERISDVLQSQAPYVTALSPFAEVASRAVIAEPRFPRSTLLHGMVHGVPVAGPVDPTLVNRPAPEDLSVELGHHGDDIAATVAAEGHNETDPVARRAAERMLSAFTGHLLDRLAAPDGLIDIEEHEHASGFTALAGGTLGTDRVRMGDASAPLTTGRPGRSAMNRVAEARSAPLLAKLSWAGKTRFELQPDDGVSLRRQVLEWTAPQDPVDPVSEVREIARPAPSFQVPAPPVVAVRGAKRSMRFRKSGLHSPDEQLQVRWASQVCTAPSLIDLAAVLPSLGSAAVPDEALALGREAILMNPYLAPWLAGVAAQRTGTDPTPMQGRFFAESALRYGRDAKYDGRSAFMSDVVDASTVTAVLVADQVRRHSAYAGVEPSPVAVTSWSQPWVPLWLEWEVALAETDALAAWTLGQIDLEPPETVTPTGRVLTHSGRSALTAGVAETMAAAITAWLQAEDARDAAGAGELDPQNQAALAELRGQLDTFDVVSATLDGWRDQLLGVPYLDGRTIKPVPDDSVPELLTRGELRLTRARLVDAFGQVIDLRDATAPAVPARDEITDPSPALRVRPRLNIPSRWLFRFVDPAGNAADAAEARLDQVDPAQTVNPVAGFLLPDHIDEALEVFDVAGAPIGQLLHEPFGGGVTWEPAPGRPIPADAGPLKGLTAREQIVGHLAAGLVAADAMQRKGKPAQSEAESALSAMLRAIDTTLWTVDTYAGLGNEHIVGLVGRPIAVVRARLSLDIKSDLADLDLSDPAKLATREQAYEDLAALEFRVRLGELTRVDDGLLGFFVDDDYGAFHIVDKVVAAEAFDSGRGKGQLGTYGTTPMTPGVVAIRNDYVIAEDELRIHPGQTIALTLLMHPACRVHLTSGTHPRKWLQLQRDWVAPGLAVMAPSARVGPLLVDPAKVSLPLISAFPKDQLFTRRDSPLTWKDDPILAATQTALLPDLPHEVQEGYIRVAPATTTPPASTGGA